MRSLVTDVPPPPSLAGGLLAFAKVCLHLDEVCLEIHPIFFMLRLGPSGSVVFLELYHFYDKSVRDSENISFGEGLARCCCVVDALVEPCTEALERLIRVIGIL